MPAVVQEIVATRLSESEFSELDPATWNALAASAVKPTIFCTYEWLDTWWQCYQHKYSFYFLAAWRDGELVGALPLARRYTRIEDGIIPCRTLQFAGSKESASDHIDILADDSVRHDVIIALSDLLVDLKGEWDLLHMSHAVDEGSWQLLFGRLSGQFGSDTWGVTEAPYLTTAGNFDDFMRARFRGKKRRQLYAMHRKLADAGLQINACSARDEKTVIQILFELHKMRFAEKGIRSRFAGDGLIEFHKSLASRLDSAGMLRTICLTQDSRIVGVLYCFQFSETVFWYQIGIDPEIAASSPGTAMVFELLQQCHLDEHINEVDFLRGPGPHKSRWTSSARKLTSGNLYGATPTGFAAKFGFRLRRRLVRFVKQLIPANRAETGDNKSGTGGR